MPPELAAHFPGMEFRNICCYVISAVPMIITAIFKCVYRDIALTPLTCTFSVKSVLQHVHKQGKSTLSALSQIFTFHIYFGMVLVWYFTSNSLWRQYPHALHVAVGIGFAEMTASNPYTSASFLQPPATERAHLGTPVQGTISYAAKANAPPAAGDNQLSSQQVLLCVRAFLPDIAVFLAYVFIFLALHLYRRYRSCGDSSPCPHSSSCTMLSQLSTSCVRT